MAQPGVREVEHEIDIAAPAQTVYQLIADVVNWPQLFPPSVHVERTALGEREERIRIWALANDEPKTWTSRRVLDPASSRIEFRQEVPQPPVAAMGGTWIVSATAAGGCRVRLLHDYRAVDDDPDQLAWIDRAVDRNSQAELAALKRNIETGAAAPVTFEDSVQVAGSAQDVYDFLDQAQLWEQRLPHVARVKLVEDTPGLQTLQMETRAKDGSVHTTGSVRVCFPHHSIVYKQFTLPALLNLHTGRWSIADHGGGLRVTSQHRIVVNPEKVTTVLGAGATVADAEAFVRDALSANSLATLQHAQEYAETRAALVERA